MVKLLSSFGKRGVNLGLSTRTVDIEDINYLSKYFVISEFNSVFTSGKNPISFNGSNFLKAGSEIKIECLDSNNNHLYVESPHGNVVYTDVSKFLISIHIYNEAYNGPGKLIFVGTTINGDIVRWIGNITIDKTLQNSSKVRFYNKPNMECRGLLYPIVTNNSAAALTKYISFTGDFYSLPVVPKKDTNQKNIDLKKIDIDYRIFINSPVPSLDLHATAAFNTQMEGQSITLVSTTLQLPFSYVSKDINVTSSFKIKKVLDSNTLQLDNPFFYTSGKDEIVTSIMRGVFTSSYTWIDYNPTTENYLSYEDTSTIPSTIIYAKQSYAEIIYRDIRTFSGFVARHKLYRRSLIYPGDFQLVVDEPIGALELLTDPVTNNQAYAKIGDFYNQTHINKYYYTSSNILQLSHSVSPHINGMRIAAPSYSDMDGVEFVIVKADSQGTINDDTYYPYSSASYDKISGSSYNSNFINLKSGSLYVLSTNVVFEKSKDTNKAGVIFYFTSSIPQIQLEKEYKIPFGLKLGEVSTTDNVSLKIFPDKQMMFFTPSTDYYGTLLVSPYNCNVILSELSLKVYGDYGFSPDVLITKIPFSVACAGESFQLKAELFDINSTLVYSNLDIVKTFDIDGSSLVFNSAGVVDPTTLTSVKGNLTVGAKLFLPAISLWPDPGIGSRLLAWRVPTHNPKVNPDGEILYTDIVDVGKIGEEQVNITVINGAIISHGTAIAVKYNGAAVVDGTFTGPFGRRYVISAGGVKTTFS